MKKVLASDNSLKIISLIIAIIIWMYIAVVMDPTIEISVRDVPIQYEGQEILESRGLAIISESATSLNIKINGSRKSIGAYDMDSIYATMDVSEAQKGSNTIPVEVIVPFVNQGISSQSVHSAEVMVEAIAEKTLNVEATTTGTLAKDYMSGDIKLSTETITVSGPESAVARIARAAVVVNVSNADVDIDAAVPIVFYDEKGKELLPTEAIMARVKTSHSEVLAHCPVLKIREISPTVNFGSQELPEGFEYTIKPDSLYIYGEEAGSTKIDKIETEEIDLEKLLENEKIKVKLRIPNNLKILYDVTEVEISVNRK